MRTALVWRSVAGSAAVVLLAFVLHAAWAQAPTTLEDFELPGSQPGDSGTLESPNKCDNCHGGYDEAVEPAFNWRGSMMSQAARDPLFFASVAIANQDAPDSGDLCLRCHTPDGWLGGRSVPTDGSALTLADREGVTCDACHKFVDHEAASGNPYPWSESYTLNTLPLDQSYLSTLAQVPPFHGNGMYAVDSNNAKRGPRDDSVARHQDVYSPFHSESKICGTCHDVSNPAFEYDDGSGEYLPNAFGTPAPISSLGRLFPIERTYSEWQMSEFNTPDGVDLPQYGGRVSSCQDCHMPDVTGKACNKKNAPVRTDLAHHDMTGGNTTIPAMVAALYPEQVDSDALAAGVQRARAMLQKAATLSVAVSQDEDSTYEAEVRVVNQTAHKLPSGYPEGRRIWINLKAFDSQDVLLYESGAYDFETAELTTYTPLSGDFYADGVVDHFDLTLLLAHWGSFAQPPEWTGPWDGLVDQNELNELLQNWGTEGDDGTKIYEIKPGISDSIAGAVDRDPGPSFHFVLNNQIFKDNRIPPRGFVNTAYEEIGSPVVDYEYDDGQYWDDTEYEGLPAETRRIVVTLYYQTTTKEFVEFLRDKNVTDNSGQVMYDLWANSGKSPPEVMAQKTVYVDGD